MTPLFKKLNYKDQKEICIHNAVPEFSKELKAIEKFSIVKNDIKDCKELNFILCFVTTKKEIDKLASWIDKKLNGDGIVWFSYPKGTSKKYKVEISRDKGWDALKQLGFETVRAVSIDADWSSLRFRRLEYIKVMTRKF